MSMSLRICTPAFREGLRDLYPGLGDEPAYWNMMGALTLPGFVEKATGRIVIARAYLADIEGKTEQFRKDPKSYSGERFLKRFKRDVLPDFEYSGWSYADGLARTVERAQLHPNVSRLQEDLFNTLGNGHIEKVSLDTGRRITRQVRADQRRHLLEHIAALPRGVGQNIVDYHNDLNVTAFTAKVRENMADAMAYVRAMPAATETERRRRDQAMAHLIHIDQEPKPYLRSVERSDRLYWVLPSLQSVQSEVRRILTRGWYEYDLKSAHAAILAKLWGVSELTEVLTQGSLWQHLADELEVDLPSAKDGIKEGFYALAFGAGNPMVKKSIEAETGDADLAERFLAAPLIKTLLKHRQRRVDEIKRDGGLVTHFGNRIEVATNKEARSALARETQAVELALIRPIYRLAPRFPATKTFTVMIYSFDGVTITYHRKDRIARLEQQIKEAVKKKADELGILTELEGGKLT